MIKYLLLLGITTISPALTAQEAKAPKATAYGLSVYNTGAIYALKQAPFGAPNPEAGKVQPMVCATDNITVKIKEVPNDFVPPDARELKRRADKWLQSTTTKSTATEDIDPEYRPKRTCTIKTEGLKGNVVLIEEDKACDMTYKCLQAQRAGALQVIIIHTTNNRDSLQLAKGNYADSLRIPCFSITHSQGDSVRAMLPSYVGLFKPEPKTTVEDTTQAAAVIKPPLNSGKGIATLKLSPNPARDIALVEYNFTEATEVRIEAINSMGQVIFTKILRGATNGTFEINTLTWANNIYILQTHYGKEVFQQKLVVQH
jgi:hypothetical protein